MGLTNSAFYSELKNNLADTDWICKINKVLNKINNGRHIFSISKEITKEKNDQRVQEMFAEFDVAQRLIDEKFFGNFNKIEYLSRSNTVRQPDFVAESKTSITPIEIKLLSPTISDERKFFQKIIDKVNKHAIGQLKNYHNITEFKTGMIFLWTHKPIPLHNIPYGDLKKTITNQVQKQRFNLTIVCMFTGYGLWDFHIPKI